VAFGTRCAYIVSSASPPKFIRPCLPTTAKAMPRGYAWLHEPKLDGYRFLIVKDGRVLCLHSRVVADWTKRLLLLAEALQVFAAGPQRSTRSWVFPTSKGRPDLRPAGSHR
jgi:hypothetical protein